MNVNYPNLILNGALLCIHLQLLIIAIFKFSTRQTRDIMLGFVCLLLSFVYIYNLYWTDYRSNLLFNIVFGGNKSFLCYACFYLYFALLDKGADRKKLLIKHLTIPVILFVSYLTLKFMTGEQFLRKYQFIYLTYVRLEHAYVLLYTILGIRLFRSIKNVLVLKTRRRYQLVYFAFFGSFLLSSVYMVVAEIYVEWTAAHFAAIHTWFFTPLNIFRILLIVAFAAMESKKLNLILSNHKIFNEYDSLGNEAAIAQTLRQLMDEEQIYRNPQLNIRELAQRSDLTEKAIRLYLQKVHEISFKEYLNSYRIGAFKELALSDESSKYDVASLGKLSGFGSKSSFYRIFKEQEKITPLEYINRMQTANTEVAVQS